MTEKQEQSAGKRLVAELSRDDDPDEITLRIRHAAQIADYIEKCDDLLTGKESAWMQVRVNRDDVVEVRISEPLRERRQLTTELRHLLGAIHGLRAKIPMSDDDDDDVTSGL